MDLRELIESYVIHLELGEHKKLSEISPKICAELIEVLEEDLAECEDEELINWSHLIQAVGLICDRIRKHDDIALAYHDVRSFVYLYDMVCFSRMAGAIPNYSREKQAEHLLPVDVDSLAQIARSACHLLRYISEDDTQQQQEAPLWFDRSQIVRSNRSGGVGFPTYTLELVGANQVDSLPSLIDLLAGLADENPYLSDASQMGQLFASKWFRQFLQLTLSQTYPLDRFTCLVALSIVADICQCDSLSQLMSETIDQIFHEESNSCNLEELLQLGNQLGSYWLSYHRRYRTTFAWSNLTEASDETRDDDDFGSQESNNSSIESDDQDNRFKAEETSADDSRARLSRIITEELLEGPKCLLCGSRLSREPLACLRHLSPVCPTCRGPSTTTSGEFCALSRQALPLIKLDFLRAQTKQVVLVSRSEWIRQLMAVKLADEAPLKETSTSERIEFGANFERLTVIRPDEYEEDERNEQLANDYDEPNDDDDELQSTVRTFIVHKWSETSNSAASESIKMLRFMREKNLDSTTNADDSTPEAKKLFLCSGDLLLLDHLDDPDASGRGRLEFRLAASSSSSLAAAHGSLWICGARSLLAKLRLGCGRLFSSLELLRHYGGTQTTTTQTALDNNIFVTCCFCQRELRQVSSFPGQWPSG